MILAPTQKVEVGGHVMVGGTKVRHWWVGFLGWQTWFLGGIWWEDAYLQGQNPWNLKYLSAEYRCFVLKYYSSILIDCKLPRGRVTEDGDNVDYSSASKPLLSWSRLLRVSWLESSSLLSTSFSAPQHGWDGGWLMKLLGGFWQKWRKLLYNCFWEESWRFFAQIFENSFLCMFFFLK